MGWTDPFTWLTGNLATAGQLNQGIRDNLLQLWTPPGVKVQRTAGDGAQSIANNVAVNMLFPSEIYDTDGFHSTVSSTGQFLVPTGLDGYYIVGAGIEFTAAAGGQRRAHIEVNNNGNMQYAENAAGTASFNTRLNPCGVLKLVGGDVVQCVVFQDSGGAVTVAIDAPMPVFFAHRIC